MVEFMVLSAPRSASTWVANWLTTADTLCLHDPIFEHRPEDLDVISSDRPLGVSCTALALLPDFVNGHPARKVVVHRDIPSIDRSLSKIGLGSLSQIWHTALPRISGMHVTFPDLFQEGKARVIYEYLTQKEFDAHRHRALCNFHIDPHFDNIPVIPEKARDFRDRVMSMLS